MRAMCQRCRESKNDWTIRTAEIHIGELKYWKLQLCELCTAQAQMIIHAALEPLSPVASEFGGSPATPTSPEGKAETAPTFTPPKAHP